MKSLKEQLQPKGLVTGQLHNELKRVWVLTRAQGGNTLTLRYWDHTVDQVFDEHGLGKPDGAFYDEFELRHYEWFVNVPRADAPPVTYHLREFFTTRFERKI